VLLAYLQGKPDLAPQYLAWIVVGLTVVRFGARLSRRSGVAQVLGVIVFAILAYLWILELPWFQPIPA
jgi:hypothetical protein